MISPTPPPGPPTAGDTGENERLRSLFDLTRHQMADALGVDRGYGWTSLAMEARQLQEDRARTALATPPPLAPNYIDPEHHGEDRELLQVFYAACNAEGGTADEIHLRGIRAVMAACTALATPPPEPPTDEERLADFTKWLAREMPPNTIIGDPLWWAPRIWRAALERWGHG